MGDRHDGGSLIKEEESCCTTTNEGRCAGAMADLLQQYALLS
jgi:hypothetical protein